MSLEYLDEEHTWRIVREDEEYDDDFKAMLIETGQWHKYEHTFYLKWVGPRLTTEQWELMTEGLEQRAKYASNAGNTKEYEVILMKISALECIEV